MYVLSTADLVWNRALDDQPGNGPGDRHLRAMAKPYNQIMANGTSAVTDTCTPEEIVGAAQAFDYLGLHQLADLTRRLVDVVGEREHQRDHAFWSLEMALGSAFERKYAQAPQDFDPVAPEDLRRSPAWALDDGARPARLVECPGEVVVHELALECDAGTACPGLDVSVAIHPWARLHEQDGCARCPSGSTWAS